jgi:G3E family GTPase
MNGCICCTVRKDLQEVLKRILVEGQKKYKLDGIIIETTGMADPAPVAQTFFMDPQLSRRCYLDAIVTLVDSKHIVTQLTRDREEGVKNEPAEQIAFADKIILNKIDLVPDQMERVEIKKELRALNPFAEIIEAEHSQVVLEKVLGLHAFSLDRVLEQEPDFLEDNGNYIYSDPKHDAAISSLCVTTENPLSYPLLQQFLQMMISVEGENLFRYKGIVHAFGEPRRYVFQGVHMLSTGSFTTAWPAEEKRDSRLVFIGRNLPKDKIAKGILNCEIANDGKLRFAIGTRVMANVGTFTKGEVIKHWNEGNAYRIRLLEGPETGTDIWAPVDRDEFVKLAPEQDVPKQDGIFKLDDGAEEDVSLAKRTEKFLLDNNADLEDEPSEVVWVSNHTHTHTHTPGSSDVNTTHAAPDTNAARGDQAAESRSESK